MILFIITENYNYNYNYNPYRFTHMSTTLANRTRKKKLKSLVVVCAGDSSLHQKSKCHWCSSHRHYDVVILYYGDDLHKRSEYKQEADYFSCQKGPKWSLVRAFLQQHRAICTPYNFVAFPDDDLQMTVDQWNKLFELGHAHRLDVFQPSLVDNGPRYIKHTHLVSQPQNTLRYTNFVEIMAPVFSQRAIQKAWAILTDKQLKSGWGMDYVLPAKVLPHRRYDVPLDHHLNHRTYVFAVVDTVAITHTKPLSNTNHAIATSFYKTFDIDPEAEMHRIMRAHRVKRFTPQTLRCVPIATNYSAEFSRCATATPRQLPTSKANTHPPTHSQPLSKARMTDLPRYLKDNLEEELRAVYQHRHPDYKKATDIHQFYHKITYGLHITIRKNKLHVVHDFGSFQSRNHNTLHMIHDVLCRYVVKDTDILVSTDDTVRFPDVYGVPILCMAKRASQTYLTYPDHTFYNWSEARTAAWDCERKNILKSNTHRCWKDKTNKAFFRGNVDTFYVRKHLATVCRTQPTRVSSRHTASHKPSNSCVSTSRKHKDRTKNSSSLSPTTSVLDVADVKVAEPVDRRHTKKRGRQTKKAVHTSFVSVADHNKWRYLLHLPGISYAARLKYLLMSNSVVMYVCKGRDYEYREFWYKYLQDGVNCVKIVDNNVYDHRNRVKVVHDARGKRIWDDRANKQIATDIASTVRSFEAGTRDHKTIVSANDQWRRTFDYELVLKYFAVLLNAIR